MSRKMLMLSTIFVFLTLLIGSFPKLTYNTFQKYSNSESTTNNQLLFPISSDINEVADKARNSIHKNDNRELFLVQEQQTSMVTTDGLRMQLTSFDKEILDTKGKRVGYELTTKLDSGSINQVEYPLLIDPLISRVTRVGHEAPFQKQSDSRIAYNSDDDEYFVVWRDMRNDLGYDVYGQIVNSNGELVGENILIVTGTLNQDYPRVAYGNGYYLVTWADQTNSSSNYYDAKAQFYTADGMPHGNVLVIDSGGGYDSKVPWEVAYNSTMNQFFVVWQDSSSGYWNIWGRHIYIDGTMGNKIQISFQNLKDESNPIAAYNPQTNEYLVAWHHKDTPSGTGDVRARRVSADGSVDPNELIYIATGSAEQFATSVVYLANTEQYMITWKDDRNSATNGSDIYGQFISSSGLLTGSNFAIANSGATEFNPRITLDGSYITWVADNGDGSPLSMYVQRFDSFGQFSGSAINISKQNIDHNYANIASTNNGFLTTWNSNDNIYGGFFTADGTPLDNGQMLHPALNNQTNTQIVYNADNNEYLLVWQDNRNGTDYDIYGQWLDNNGALIGDNFVIVSDLLDQTEPQVAYGNGKYLVVWKHRVNGGHPASSDVLGQFISATTKNLDGGVITIEADNNYADVENPTDLLYDPVNDKFFVLWQDLGTGWWNIWGAHILQSGIVENKLQLSEANTTHEYDGRVAYNSLSDEYLVVWHQKLSESNRDVYARRVNSQGTVYGAPIVLATGPNNQFGHAVTFLKETNQYLVAWHENDVNDYNIFGQLISSDGSLMGEAYTVTDDLNGNDIAPQLTNSGSGKYTLFWNKDGNIYEQLLDDYGQLQGNSYSLLNRNNDIAGMSFAQNGHDRFLLTWEESNANIDSYITGIEIPVVGLAINKSGPAQVGANDPITYELTISNTGNINVNNIVVTDVLPSGATFISATDGGILQNNIVEWHLATIPSNTSFQVSFVVTATDTITNEFYYVKAENWPSVAGTQTVTTQIVNHSTTQTINVRVSQSSDDAEELNDGNIYLTSSDLELVDDHPYRPLQTIGIRFDNINIPKGAEITQAYLTFTTDETDSEETSLLIHGQAAGNAQTFSNSFANVSNRSLTSEAIHWPLVETWDNVGETHTTPNLKMVVQEIIDLPTWQQNNAIAFIITGNGQRTAESYDGDPNSAPLLHIEYSFDESNKPPTIATPNDQTNFESDPVALQIIANDPNGDSLLFTATGLPTGLSIDSNLGFISGTLPLGSAGSYSVTIEASDGILTETISFMWEVQELSSGNIQTIEVRINQSSDDAEERNSGYVNLTSSDLELVDDQPWNAGQTVGLRFDGINIPQGAQITTAYLVFTADETDSETTSLTIYGEAVGNAQPFTNATNNITNRTLTSAAMVWSPVVAWNDIGDNHTTPELKTVIQEIINLSSWETGNAMAFVITGSGQRTAESYDGLPYSAPLLHIEYSSTITPTTDYVTSVTANADAYVRSGSYADNNYEGTGLVVKAGGSNYKRESHLKFDLTNLGSCTVQQATLQFHVISTQDNTPVPISLYQSTSDDWLENTITWNNKPAYGNLILTETVHSAGWVVYDVTDFIQAELANDQIASFVLWDNAESNLMININSREHSGFEPILTLQCGA